MHPSASFEIRVFVVICAAAVLFLLWVFANLLAEPKRGKRRKQ